MKKVLHISKYYYPFIGGVEQVARDCVTSLAKNYEQKVICFNHNKGNVVDKVDGVEVERVGCFAKIASQSLSFSYGKKLKKIVKDFAPDIIIFHYPNPFVAHFLKGILKNTNIKFILYWHLDIIKQKLLSKFFNGQNEFLLNRADKVVATSPNYIEGSRFLSKYKDKCVIIPCCVNEDRLKYNDNDVKLSENIKNRYQGKIICFAFGRHVEYKGLTYLIKASQYLDSSFKILIGGKGPLTDDLMEEAKNDSKIEFLGRISNEELKAYFLASNIFCFPSITKNEAFGIGLAEAMYYKLPTITFTIPGSGVNYVSLNGITGKEVPNRDFQSFANAIIELSKDNELCKKYGDAGYRRVIDEFTYSKFEKNIEFLLNE